MWTIAALLFATAYALGTAFSLVVLMASLMGLRPCEANIFNEIFHLGILTMPLTFLISSIFLMIFSWRNRRKLILAAILIPLFQIAVVYASSMVDTTRQIDCKTANPNWLERRANNP